MHEFSLSKDIEDMDEGDLRSTLDAFMDKHADNREAYDDLAAERDEFSEQIEALEGDLQTAQAYFAKRASDYTHLDAEVICDRFSLEETIEMAGEAEEAAEAAVDAETEEEFSEDGADEAEESESVFADKPDKAPIGGGEGTTGFASEAKADLERVLGVDL
jgi:septal ring factor EnvC (AmiA/AmiB activator)